jgi:hypothetical protein
MVFCFVACNQVEPDTATYGVYLKSAEVVDGQCVVHLSRSGSDEALGQSQIAIVEEKGHFVNTYTYTVTFDGEAIFCAVQSRLTQDGTILNGAEYSTLKIVYDYATIYKSIKSDGEHSKSGRNYVHSFDVSNGPFEATLTRKIPRQSTWYAVLLGGAGAVIVAFVVAHLVRGKYCRKTQEN